MATLRNKPCSCGSGKKFKHCCAEQPTSGRNSATSQLPYIRLDTGEWVQVPQALEHAIGLHQQKRLLKARTIYQQIVQVCPDQADARHLLGTVYHQIGDQENAYEQISQAIALNPRAAPFHNNLGEVCRALKRPEEALASFAHALSLQPELLEAQRNVGLALLEQNQADEAIAHLRQVVTRFPRYPSGYWALGAALAQKHKEAEALEVCERGLEQAPLDEPLLCARGLLLNAVGRPDEAIQHFRQAIQQQPHIPEFHHCLFSILKRVGDIDGAIACLESELRLRPNDASAQHLLASLKNVTPDRAPAPYVTALFDSYADNFDRHLVEKLEYRTPSMLARTLRDAIGHHAAGMSILDLGCGTGLFGVEVKDIKQRLTGIDLAPKMVEKARERCLYDQLLVGDLLDYLVDAKAGDFDLIAATDVFNYVGNLQPVFTQVSRLLTAGDLFAFSLEAAPQEVGDFVLDKTGRYSHSKMYVPRLCHQHGFVVVCHDESTLRMDGGKPVAGYLYVLRKAAQP